MYLILYQGNNYYNRKIMREESHEDYVNVRGFKEVATVDNLAFIANDGIAATQIVNEDADKNGFPDYAVLYDDSNTPISRWWITESVILRRGQYRVSMLRDVLADWYDEVLNAPSYIRKGYPQSINDPAILNNESMIYNQIKTKEVFITDKTGCGWYVGYLSKDVKNKLVKIPGEPVSASGIYNTEAEYPYSKYKLGSPFICDYTSITHNLYCYEDSFGASNNYVIGFDGSGAAKTPEVGDGYKAQLYFPEGIVSKGTSSDRGFKLNTSKTLEVLGLLDKVYNAASNISNWNNLSYTFTGAHSEAESASFFNSENGRIIKIGGIPKKVILNQSTTTKTITIDNSSTYGQQMKRLANDAGIFSTSTISGSFSSITFTSVSYYITYEDVSETDLDYTIPETRTSTNGVPYDIIAVPASPIRDIQRTDPSSPDLSQKLVAAIITDLEGDKNAELYDFQYVPYCPLADKYLYEGVLDTKALTNDSSINYDIIQPEGSAAYTIAIYASEASFTKTINGKKIYMSKDVENYKVESECNMYRLCSPNYNGQFEFSAAANGGVSGWNIAFTYKPYTPYIKVSPIFGRLYGKDFGDARGLICGGDFSLTQTDDAWKSYELQNKNYQVIFDRQIQNMRVNNFYQHVQDGVNAITGTVQGTATGAMAGSMTGTPYGAAIGAVVGGITSAAGGIGDVMINRELRKEAMSFAQDLYGYNLQNIKALPYSLTKVGSQNTDYKIWPFVETYTATETEKEALRNKLRWNGYSIERIGNIGSFLKPEDETFIQATVIRLDQLGEDSHVANVINAELQTGVFII